MYTALMLLAVLGLLGAFDTLYYHEYRCQLPVLGSRVGGELRLHASRDVIYSVFFITLPFVAWCGWLTLLLAVLLIIEISITIADFNVEVKERAPIGGVGNWERSLHLIMAVVYGTFLANLVPLLPAWASAPTGFELHDVQLPLYLTSICPVLGAGVLLSGIRDLFASYDFKFAQRVFWSAKASPGLPCQRE